ncbi:DUF397 domain-containing protein [Actinomadura parmotrematis]|uniref:DUF397 domain-containing protein n=1 Tax=Actinomadura parmotrematis TaxID=2864039 RepID=UPI00215DBCFB|nr:DUF397 domain-containing protein [Actinomadura parmotrematis]
MKDHVSGAVLAWRKSTRSFSSDDCVEVAPLPSAAVLARDSKDAAGGAVLFDRAGWRALLTRVKEGELDLPGR